MSGLWRNTYRHALQPFLERAGRGAADVLSWGDAGVFGAGGWSCGVMPVCSLIASHVCTKAGPVEEWSGLQGTRARSLRGPHAANESNKLRQRRTMEAFIFVHRLQPILHLIACIIRTQLCTSTMPSPSPHLDRHLSQ
jgi:hypothetical protein